MNRIRKTTNNYVANSLEKAAQAIRTALIDADCNEDATNLLDRMRLHDAISYINKVVKLLQP